MSSSSNAEPKSPTLEALPKLPSALKDEVVSAAAADSPTRNLKHVETHEKNVLPTKEDLEQEKQHEAFKEGIEKFETQQLRHVDVKEKEVLPTSEDIAKEKAPRLAAEFNHAELKHVEPQVKTDPQVISTESGGGGTTTTSV
jgi:hypothetical protein